MRSPDVIPRSPFRSDRGGFALLITLTLLAFLVILLIGLATYTRIEGAIAGNSQRQAQARQNALLALNVALNQLQKHAGPDQRVTATAESFGGIDGTRHYTGVWSAGATGPAAQTWLVSGNENDPLAVIPAVLPAEWRELLGKNTSGVREDVKAPAVELRAPGVPGQSASATVGRYAWWVGDQGVKAPVAVPDRTNEMTYPPYDSAELRGRVRQQMGLGAGAALFDSRDLANAALVKNITTPSQLAFARKADGTEVGEIEVRQNYSAWSPNNFAVQANTKLGGLRRDLSVRPDLLGAAFAAWADYPNYMEDPATLLPPPLSGYSEDPVRRRYRITPRTVDAGIEHRIAPVLSFFGISFSLRNDTQNNSPTTLEASVRCVVGLWNPYTAALVPEDLELVLTGLPVVLIGSNTNGIRPVSLAAVFSNSGGEVKFDLPFTANSVDVDRSTWLPGRVYNWSAVSTTSVPGSSGFAMAFDTRDATQAGDGVVIPAGPHLGPKTFGGGTPNMRVCSVPDTQALTLELRRKSTGDVLGRSRSPVFEVFTTTPRAVDAEASDFAYVFRLADSREIPVGADQQWLEATGRDPREFELPSAGGDAYVVAGGQQPSPPLLSTNNNAGFATAYPQTLLDRAPSQKDYTHDVPVFELPRSPVLSVGVLQHLSIPAERPFSVGNSWGGARNSWFDNYFFSGLREGVAWPALDRPLPNAALHALRRKHDGSNVEVDDVRGPARLADGFSSKHLLQSAAFNLNSVSKEAWTAVLRGIRFPAGAEPTMLALDDTTGASDDSTVQVDSPLAANASTAAFLRFSQSKQETFRAKDDFDQSSSPSAGLSPVINNTPLFRRGVRFLSAAELTRLTEAITGLVVAKHADSGPFRGLQEFLTPLPIYLNAAGVQASLLEKAIEDAGLNTDAALQLTNTSVEFSSQFLTQGDIMTALAPVLFPRSDTFVIRSYGEAVNPTTGATEGRAWCEATVQRVPDYFDPSQPAEAPPADLNLTNQTYGRRFKVVSFRWLTRSDI